MILVLENRRFQLSISNFMFEILLPSLHYNETTRYRERESAKKIGHPKRNKF
jgi:hypothetical protein